MLKQVGFKLGRGAVAQGRVAAVKLEVGVEVVGHFQAGFFQAGKRAAVGQQLGFQGASACSLLNNVLAHD